MNAWANFNDAEEQQDHGDIIPKGTIAKVHMKIRPGGHDDPSQGWTGEIATRNDSTGSVYLDAEFTVIGGPYNKRKIWSLIGLYSPKGPKWQQMGRSFIRAALESARGIKAEDASELAMKARQINGLSDLNGLEFVVKVDVDPADPGSEYSDKNVIRNVIGVSHKEYQTQMAGTGAATSSTSAPAQANQGSTAGQPAWLNG